jgi:hypothetical protein
MRDLARSSVDTLRDGGVNRIGDNEEERRSNNIE